MSTTLYYIIGTSDVCINSQTRVPNYYELCRTLYQSLEANKNIKTKKGKLYFPEPVQAVIELEGGAARNDTICEITFPLLEPILSQIDPFPDQIIFFATHQQPPYKTDTYWAARLLEKYLNNTKRELKVRIEEISDDPSDHDKMMTFFTEYRRHHLDEMQYSLKNYFYLSPGTPAAVTSFSLAVSDLDFDYYYLPRGSTEIKRVTAFTEFNRQRYKEALSRLLKNFEFKGALALVENSVYQNDQRLLDWLKALDLRHDFNYRESLEKAKRLKNEANLYRCFDVVSDIINGEPAAYAKEMIARIEIEFEQGRSYLGLAFLFNLLEIIRTSLLEKYAGIKLDSNEKQNGKFIRWEKYIDECQWIVENERKAFKEYGPSRINVYKLLKKLNDNELHDEKLGKILQFLHRLETVQVNLGPFKNKSLQELRNIGPLAHGMSAPGENLLEMIWLPYGTRGFFDELKDFYKTVFDKPIAGNHLKTLIEYTLNML